MNDGMLLFGLQMYPSDCFANAATSRAQKVDVLLESRHATIARFVNAHAAKHAFLKIQTMLPVAAAANIALSFHADRTVSEAVHARDFAEL